MRPMCRANCQATPSHARREPSVARLEWHQQSHDVARNTAIYSLNGECLLLVEIVRFNESNARIVHAGSPSNFAVWSAMITDSLG